MVEKQTIIIVEDNENDLFLLLRFLKQIGFDDEFQNLIFRNLDGILSFLIEQKALTKEQRTQIAAFFVDGKIEPYSNGTEDGTKITKAIREDKFYNRTPIISNSGGGNIPDTDYDLRKLFSNKTADGVKALINNKKFD